MQNWKAFITIMLIYWSVGFALILLYHEQYEACLFLLMIFGFSSWLKWILHGKEKNEETDS